MKRKPVTKDKSITIKVTDKQKTMVVKKAEDAEKTITDLMIDSVKVYDVEANRE